VARFGMAKDLTILIGNTGALENLRTCFRSIFATVGNAIAVRVIQFPGGERPTPGPRTRVSPGRAAKAPGRLGYCRVYNQSIACSTGHHALILGDDTVMGPG